MDLGIKGKKAIINGGSAGMGFASALSLAREGVDLVISARGEERLHAACKNIADETGVSVTPIATDHSTEEGRAKILAACPEPDILVGTCSPPAVTGDYTVITAENWQDALAMTLISPIEFMRAVVPGMAERGWGRVVNIATVAAKNPTEMRLLSGTPRAALANYATAVSKKVARHNVVINNLLPGMYESDSILERYSKLAEENGTTYEEELQKSIKRFRIPTRKFGQVEDFGPFCAILCSQYANNIIGQNIVIDGGITNTTF